METARLAPGAAQPRVWNWYRAYCAAMALLYLACGAAGVWALTRLDELAEGDPEERFEIQVAAWVFALLCVPLFALFAAAPFLPRRPWAWVYHLVLICMGMTSACCLPISIPLLVFWIKPGCKAFFGRGAPVDAPGPWR